MNIFGREPAVLVAVVASALQLGFGLFLHASPDQQAAVNIAVSAVAGLVLAWQVAAEKGLALLGGAAKALVAVAIAFGWKLTEADQASVMTLVNLVVAAVVRSQVEAPVPGPGVVVGTLESFPEPVPTGRHEVKE